MFHHALGVVSVPSFVALKPPAPWHISNGNFGDLQKIWSSQPDFAQMNQENNIDIFNKKGTPNSRQLLYRTSISNRIEVTSHSWFQNLLWTPMMQ